MEKITVEQYCNERNASIKYVSQHTDYILFHKGDIGNQGVSVRKQREPKFWFKIPVYSHKQPYDKATIRAIRRQFKSGKINRINGHLQSSMTTIWQSNETAPSFSELEEMYYRQFDFCLYMKDGILMCNILDSVSKATIKTVVAGPNTWIY